MSSDPYATLGVKPGASDAELRAAYRRLVQLHHPDHNGGSPESARRFEEIQSAYARVRELRADRPAPASTAGRADRPGPASTAARADRPGPASTAGRADRPGPASTATDPDLDSRLAAMEREVATQRVARARREREAARERARRAAREATATDDGKRPSDEELGIFHTDDSISKILSDAVSELSGAAEDLRQHVSDQTRERHVGKRVSELLDELGSRLGGDHSEN